MQNTVGNLMERIVATHETRQRPVGEGDTFCKSWGEGGGGGGQTRKMHMGKCSCICIWRVRRIPAKRTNSGCDNRSRGCLQQSPVQAADGPAHPIWSQPNTDPMDWRSAPGKNSGYTAWKLQLCSSSVHNRPTRRITDLTDPLECLY